MVHVALTLTEPEVPVLQGKCAGWSSLQSMPCTSLCFSADHWPLPLLSLPGAHSLQPLLHLLSLAPGSQQCWGTDSRSVSLLPPLCNLFKGVFSRPNPPTPANINIPDHAGGTVDLQSPVLHCLCVCAHCPLLREGDSCRKGGRRSEMVGGCMQMRADNRSWSPGLCGAQGLLPEGLLPLLS